MRKVALIGAGRGGSALLPIISEYKDIEVVGIADRNPQAPGLKFAQKKNIPIFSDYKSFLNRNDLDVILNLTGDSSLSDELISQKKGKTEILGGLGSRLLWDLVYERKKKEEEKVDLLEELSRANQELKETKNYLEDILEDSADMIITTNKESRIVKFNRGAEKILNFRREEVIGKPVTNFYLDKEERKKILKILETEGSISNYETKLLNRDKKIIDIIMTISQLKNDQGEIIGTVGVSKDITDKKKLEKELVASNKELENFVYTVSHDLQSPLRAIDGFSNLLTEEYADKIKGEGERYIRRIKDGAARMKKLIEDLLDLSRIGRATGFYEDVNFNALIQEVKNAMQFEIDKKKAVIKITKKFPVIYCDRSRMSIVFTNLISNALKYTAEKKKPKIILGYKNQADKYEIFVQDNGIGISSKYYHKIFEIFQRLHRNDEYEGTGIGLTLVKRIIDLHNGKIWVKSTQGKGSTFYFTLPKHLAKNN